MDTCSTEIVTLIFKMACRDDFGQTARNLGLVSKYFRAIAEPIELRTIAVSGIDQLRGAVARLEKATSGVGPAKFGVRHLFISEIKAEHALAADMEWSGYSRVYDSRESFWRTEQGIEAETFYRDQPRSDEFWRMAIGLVKNSSSKLRTLYLVSSDKWLPLQSLSIGEIPSFSWKIQGAISGVAFPNLASLMVHHWSVAEDICSTYSGQLFKTPHTPSLRKLCIRSSIFLDHRDPQRVHPLLELVHSETSKMTRLFISSAGMYGADKVMRAIFGEDMETLRKTRALPKELQSVVLQQGIMPMYRCGTGFSTYVAETNSFAKSIQEVGIDGLKTQPPTPTYPKVGEREFELMLAEWKEDVLTFSS